VASAFYQKENAHVFILFPKDGVSQIQKQQLTCWGENVSSIAIEGTFDDCQRMVKETFSHMEKNEDIHLSSANSINIGRLLPQMIYSFFASMLTFFEDFGEFPVVIVPSGNLGNALSALWAQKLGAPIQKVIFACNENDALYRYYQTKEWTPQKSIKTLANAMDVGNPSNMERILDLYSYEELMEKTACYCVSNDQIKETIGETFNKYAQPICPHTACAEYVRKTYYNDDNAIVYATAHPCKFPEVCTSDLIDEPMDIPYQLEELLEKPSSFDTLLPNSTLLAEYIKKKIS
jgi:threonine synthase